MAQVGRPSPQRAEEKEKRKKQKLPRARFGRPCALQRQVPAVQGVRAASSSVSVHLRLLDIPVVRQRQVRGSVVQKTVVVPQLQSIEGRLHSFRAAEADPHGPDCSADHGDSAVAAHFGGRCPCCAGRADSQVLPWRRPWRSHCSSLRNRRSLYSDCRKLRIFRSCSSSRSLSSCRDDEALPRGPCDHGDSPVAFGHGGQYPHYVGRTGVHPCRGAEADSHGLDCSADRRSSPVAWTRWLMLLFSGVQVVDIPVVAQRRFPVVQFIMQTTVIPQLQSIDKVFDVPVCTSSSFLGCSL